MLEEGGSSISPTVSSVTDLPIPSQKSTGDLKGRTPPLLRKPSRIKHRPQDDIEVQSLSQGEDVLLSPSDNDRLTFHAILASRTKPRSVHLTDLPIEVQEGIIDHLAGNLLSTTSDVSSIRNGCRNWSVAMRHPRRRQLTDLALISRTWRRLIQERLFRHIKIKGTKSGLEECEDWFCAHNHLQGYVRHFEVWVPIWEMKAGRRTTQMPPVTNALSPRFQDALIGTQPNLRPALELNDMALTFQQASQNATLEEIFFYACALFPAAYALTIEGGQGKRSPMVQPFRDPWNPNHPHKSRQVIFTDGRSYLKERLPKLPIHPNIGTLVLKGAWNIIRQPSDFDTIVEALPNLREWHCLYAKPKTEAYKTLCMLIRSPPPTIHHLNICLDGLCGKPSSFPEKWRSVYDSHHLCVELGTLAPNLESISFTGRICGSLFKTAVASALRMRDPPNLKSVDLIVRNCCRSSSLWNDGTGIYNLDFIAAFTRLVIEAIRSLRTFTKLNFLRIRFIDLDSPNPLLNPYFQMQGNTVMGIWNEEILSTVKEARPDARFEGLEYYEQGWGSREMVGERAMGGGRPKSICVDTYSLLLDSS